MSLYKTLKKIDFYCKCIEKCAAYKHFGISDFDKFVRVAGEYCLSENNVNCERYKLRKSG